MRTFNTSALVVAGISDVYQAPRPEAHMLSWAEAMWGIVSPKVRTSGRIGLTR